MTNDTFAKRAARRMSHAELLAAYHHDLGPIEKTGPGEETRLTVLRKDAK